MTELYINTTSRGGQCGPDPDPDDMWDRADTWSEHDIRSVHANKHNHMYMDSEPIDFKPVVGQQVHVLHVQWSSGDSFGNDQGGCHEVIAIYQDIEKARAEMTMLEATVTYGEITLSNNVPYYIPWHGYFEALDWLKVETFTIQE